MATTPIPVRLSDQQQKELGIRAALASMERSDFIRDSVFLFDDEEHAAIQRLADAAFVDVHEYVRRMVRVGINHDREKDLLTIADTREKFQLNANESLYHMMAQVLTLVQGKAEKPEKDAALKVADAATDAKFGKLKLLQVVIDKLHAGDAAGALTLAKELQGQLATMGARNA